MTSEEILAVHRHRPWPLPQRPWLMRQAWNRLLFAHWALPPHVLRPLVPQALPLDVRDGRCWVAVTPFHLSGLRGRGLPPVPGTSAFPELNVRTYVVLEGKPGVYFFSLDAGSVAAVLGARAMYGLPYFYANMRIRCGAESVHYSCVRRHLGKTAEFEGDYTPVGPIFTAAPGSLEHFLTERYCLYVTQGAKVFRAEIHHVPWPLQPASADISINTMAQAAGITVPRADAVLHFAKRLEVLVWAKERVI